MSSMPDPGAETEPATEIDPAEVPEVRAPDPRLFEAHDLALAALREVTPEATIGAPAEPIVEGDGVVSLRFQNTLAGYPGWFWTVSLAAVDGEEPTVLEVELLPGDGALVAPEWVPWSVRLREYKEAQAAQAAEQEASEEDVLDDALDEAVLDEDDDTLDDDDLDDDDLDDDALDDDELDDDLDDFDEEDALRGDGDVDGVDIDELDEDAARDDDVVRDEDDALDEDVALDGAEESPADD